MKLYALAVSTLVFSGLLWATAHGSSADSDNNLNGSEEAVPRLDLRSIVENGDDGGSADAADAPSNSYALQMQQAFEDAKAHADGAPSREVSRAPAVLDAPREMGAAYSDFSEPDAGQR